MPIVVLGGAGGLGNAIPSTLPAPVTNFVASASSAGINLSWNNPTSYFTGVMIRLKPDSAPTSITDGLQIYVGKANSFLFKPPADGTYYFRAYPFNSNNQYQTITNGQIINAEYKSPLIYGVRIDTLYSDPAISCVYTDAAVGMSPSLGNNGNFIDNGWDDINIFKAIRPCLLKNGEVVGYLQKNNFSKFEDGTTADITSGNSGDVMIEIPPMAYMIYTEGRYLYVKVMLGTEAKQVDSRFVYYAHETPNISGDYGYNLYIGAYLGYVVNGALRSLSGKSFAVKTSYSQFQTLANKNGNGYSMLSFYPLTLLQCLYIIRYKNLNSQVALGTGVIDNSSPGTTGITNTLGMNYGTAVNSTTSVKCNGIEDMWGSCRTLFDGLYCSPTRDVMTAYGNFNATGDFYMNQGTYGTSDFASYIMKCRGTNESGFIIRTTGGSATTYFCDGGALYAGYLPTCGDNRSNRTGIFNIEVNQTSSAIPSYVGSRLQYIKNVK